MQKIMKTVSLYIKNNVKGNYLKSAILPSKTLLGVSSVFATKLDWRKLLYIVSI